MAENMRHKENIFSNNSCTSASAQDEIEEFEERAQYLLTESIATVTRLTALVTEMQVNCIRREVEFARIYNPKLLERSRNILDQYEDQLNRVQEMLSTILEEEIQDEEVRTTMPTQE